MDYNVSEERQTLLQEKFFEFSFDEREPDKEFFDSITNPVELHLIAGNYNWDDGAEVLTWIIDSPLCDKATAAMTFWHSQPSYYTQFDNEEEASWAGDVYTLLRKIIENFELNFYKTTLISYNPQTDPKAEGVEETEPKAKWSIPDYLKQPIIGQMEIELD